jgi:hypothetical protein
MDMSNKSLALLLVAAIIISLGGTMLSLNQMSNLGSTKEGPTGRASSTGDVNLSISQLVECTVESNVNFGTAGKPSGPVTLSTDTDNSGDGFNNCAVSATCSGMEVNNTGNLDLSVTFNSTKNGTTLLGEAIPSASDFRYYVRNGTASGAATGCSGTLGTANNVSLTNNAVCTNLTYIDNNDIITIEYNVSIDQDTPPGSKGATITVTCAQA